MHLLAIVAHPDDADIFCGGTLAKHADRGDTVTIAHMTRGEFGGFGGMTEEDVAETREAEARAAGEVLGADEVTFFGFADGRITHTYDNRVRIVEQLRRYDPDLVLTHFRDDMHPDHQATARLVTDAYYMASLELFETESEPCDPDNVLYFGKPTSSFEPTTFVDISEYTERKRRAIEQHESQIEFLTEHGGIDSEFDNLVEGIVAEDTVRGKQAGVAAAEGFGTLHERATQYLGTDQ